MKLRMTSRFWQRLVLERMHRVLAIVIALQLIQSFEDYWWEETYAVVYGALAVTAVVELLFTRGFVWRFAFQCVSAVVLTVYLSPFRWAGWPDTWRSWTLVGDFFSYHAEQLHPFAEIAIGVVFGVQAMAWLGRKRAGAIAVVVVSIATMATVDSFFPVELWRNIAWIVTVGLAWLVVLHLRQLQARHPDSWEALAERPFDLALPAVIIISLVILTGVFLPRAPVLLEDPYTIWAESQGREVPVFEGEGGVLKVTPSTGSSGSSLSGYGRDDKRIGGGFEFDYSPVMTVTTSQKSYWRGETKSMYTGQGWADVKNPPLTPVQLSGEPKPLDLGPGRSDALKTIEVTQTVNVSRKDKVPVLFAAGPATLVADLKSGNNAGLQWNQSDWELRFNKTTRVESYTVVSQVAVLDETALRAIPTSSAEGSSIDVEPYLQLPDSVPERVRQLAIQETSAATNDYDRAKALESYLKTFPYTNTPDESKRTSKDVADAFLFEIQQGYCDYFSTTFVVMARSIGLPARWVKGYSTGYNPEELERARFGFEIPDPSGAGTYTVRNADAHSWAEVYFEGYGWIPFEPTSGFAVPQPLPEGQAPETVADPVADPNPAPVGLNDKQKDWLVPAGAAGVILIILGLVYVFYRRVGIIRLWGKIRSHGTTPDQRIVREMEKLVAFLGRRGLRREAHETMRETFSRFAGKFTSLRPEFEGALSHFEHARYGADSDGERRLQQFNEAAIKIKKTL